MVSADAGWRLCSSFVRVLRFVVARSADYAIYRRCACHLEFSAAHRGLLAP